MVMAREKGVMETGWSWAKAGKMGTSVMVSIIKIKILRKYVYKSEKTFIIYYVFKVDNSRYNNDPVLIKTHTYRKIASMTVIISRW